MKKIIFGMTCLVWLISVNAFAATIYFKDGKKVEGQIVEKTDRALKVNVQGITLTYYMDEIDRIEGEAAGNAANPQFLASLPQSLPRAAPAVPLEAALSSGSGGMAQPPSMDSSSSSTGKRGLVMNLIESSGAREQMNQIFSQIIAQAPPEDAQKVRELINIDEMIGRLVPVYEKYFSEEELKNLTAFYQSPLGRKLLMATPVIVEESMQASMAYLQERLQIQSPVGQGQ